MCDFNPLSPSPTREQIKEMLSLSMRDIDPKVDVGHPIEPVTLNIWIRSNILENCQSDIMKSLLALLAYQALKSSLDESWICRHGMDLFDCAICEYGKSCMRLIEQVHNTPWHDILRR